MFCKTQVATVHRNKRSRRSDHSNFSKNAINCTGSGMPVDAAWNPSTSGAQGMSDGVHTLISNSLSEATRRAYRSDVAHYERWGGIIPSAPNVVAEYLAELTETHTVATISRRIASLAKAHRALGTDDPTKAEIVKATMRGIRRMIGTAQREAKPVLREDLFQMLAQLDDSPKARRDKALLLLGFAGAFRRSELVGLDIPDIEHVRQGIIVKLRRSKTDQTGSGREIGIPFGRTRWCPVKHLSDWLDYVGIEEGPIFRSINRHGHVASTRLSGNAVSDIVKQLAKATGFDPCLYSGHSLRAGFCTGAAIAGASMWKIRQQSGHASENMLSRYLREADLFRDNAADNLF